MKKTSISALLLTGMVLLVPCGCENGQDDLRITLETDFSEVLSTIEQSSRLLSEQMARIESLMRQGLADNQSAVEQIRQAVAGGYKKLSASLLRETMQLRVKLLDSYAVGDKFHLKGYITVWFQPDENDSSFKPKLVEFCYDLIITIVN